MMEKHKKQRGHIFGELTIFEIRVKGYTGL